MFREILIVVIFVVAAHGQTDRTPRIVGGRNAGIGEVPFQISLRTWGTQFHFCGGVLLNNRWALTAASCVHGRPHNSLNMVAGITSLRELGVARRSRTIVIHPSFHNMFVDHNLACIQSASIFPINQNIQPIFVSSFIIRDIVTAQVSGWGATTPDAGINSDWLQILNVETTGDVVCDLNHSGINTDANLCTHNPVGRGICTTDVGSPLVSNSQLIGIASWYSPCAQGVSDVYVRISSYRFWIGSVTGV